MLANKNMTRNVMHNDELLIVKTMHTTVKALKEFNEKETSNRLKEIIVRSENQTASQKIEI